MPISKKKAKKIVKPQRPFYKSNGYENRAKKLAENNDRFVRWICSPDNKCVQMEEKPFTENVYWRIFRIIAEFIEGFEFLSDLKNEVTFFGSARISKNSKYYKHAVSLGKMCAKAGYTVITGGGPGIMEAGNKGAIQGGGESVGLDIELPTTQRRNEYVTRAIGFHYFFTRKVMLSASAQAYVFFPGGFGTMDEAFEMLTLVQTGKVPKDVPCIFIGKDYWQPLLDWIEDTLLEKNKFIAKKDLELIKLVDTPEQAFEIINKTVERKM